MPTEKSHLLPAHCAPACLTGLSDNFCPDLILMLWLDNHCMCVGLRAQSLSLHRYMSFLMTKQSHASCLAVMLSFGLIASICVLASEGGASISDQVLRGEHDQAKMSGNCHASQPSPGLKHPESKANLWAWALP